MAAKLLERIATHEAGHTVACVTYAVPIVSVTVVVTAPDVRRGPVRGDLGV
jgi:hypothetical protein